jgi:small multidrug resistance family-3 protein
MNPLVWLIFVTAAILEVSGDAMIWKGLRGWGWAAIVAGGLMLAGYGLMVNLVKWEFAKLLGVYVAVFAVVSISVGCLVFHETVPRSTWLGLGLIVVGGLVIQFGRQ